MGILVKFYCTFLFYLPRESLSNPTNPFFYTCHRNPCLIVPYLSSIFAPEIFFKLCCIFLLYFSLGSVSNCSLPFCLFLIVPYLCFAVTCMYLQCCGSRSGGSVNNWPPGSGSVNSELRIREIKEKNLIILSFLMIYYVLGTYLTIYYFHRPQMTS